MVPEFDPKPVIRRIWQSAGLPLRALPEYELTGSSAPELQTSFMVSEIAQITTALSALAASYLNELRTGEKRVVTVDKREAAREFKIDAWTWLDGEKPGHIWDPYAGIYRASDGWLWLHTNYEHHRRRLFDTLGLPPSPSVEQLREVISTVECVPFETLATSRGCALSALRTFQEWDTSPQGLAAREIYERDGPVRVARDGEGEGTAAWAEERGQLAEGVKVLDMTRVVAGPVGGRVMALRGAQVLAVRCPDLPGNHAHDMETTRGKRTARLDLRLSSDRDTLAASILPSTSIFLQSYRDGCLSDGYPELFFPCSLRRRSPNLIVTSLSAYGPIGSGPWGGKRGYDSLVQAAMGFNLEEGRAWAELANGGGAVEPKRLPVSVLDYASGELLAFGMLAALCRQYMDGGTYSVTVSLASVAYFLRFLGRHPCEVGFSPTIELPHTAFPPAEEVKPFLGVYHEVGQRSRGRQLTSLRHAGRIQGMAERNHFAGIELDAFPLAWAEAGGPESRDVRKAGKRLANGAIRH